MDNTQEAPPEGGKRDGKKPRAEPTTADKIAEVAENAAKEKAADAGHGRLRAKKAARAALREAGLPVDRAGREAAVAQEQHWQTSAPSAKANGREQPRGTAGWR